MNLSPLGAKRMKNYGFPCCCFVVNIGRAQANSYFPRGISKDADLQTLLFYECDVQKLKWFYINLKQIYVQDNKPDG